VWPKSRKQKDAEAKKARKEREAAAAVAATTAGEETGDEPSTSVAAGLESLSLGASTESGSAEPTPSTEPAPQQVAHFVMNLPDSALTFLDAYRGSYVALEDKLSAGDLASQANARETINMPMVHVYCFTREMERANAERDICARASQYLGYDLTPAIGEYNLHLVRSVAPNKEMYCLSFRLPEEVAFAKD
jgi:tRNA (guanine37-N1)-methyltransferase